MLNQSEFDALAAQGYNRIPVTLALFADLDTPLSVYLKLANQPYSYLLESVVGGERFGRYSFIGLPAATRLRVNGKRVQVEHGDRVLEPTTAIHSLLSKLFKIASLPHRSKAYRAFVAVWLVILAMKRSN